MTKIITFPAPTKGRSVQRVIPIPVALRPITDTDLRLANQRLDDAVKIGVRLDGRDDDGPRAA